MKLAPICLFTYNRLEETQQTIAALQKNYLAKSSELFVFSDGSKNETARPKIQGVRDFLKSVDGFKKVKVYESDTNKGLAASIIAGVSKMFENHDSVIILEDDLITTPNFLDFMNNSLDYYKNDTNIYTVNGYSPLIKNLDPDTFYLHSRSFPWGWGTWRSSWKKEYFDKNKIRGYISSNPGVLKKFDMYNGEDASEMLLRTLDGEISSWYIRWVFNNYLENKKSVFPSLSKVQNIGDSEDATHYTGGVSAYQSKMDSSFKTDFDFEKTISLKNNDYRFLKYFSKKYKLIFRLKMLITYRGFKMIMKEVKAKLFK